MPDKVTMEEQLLLNTQRQRIWRALWVMDKWFSEEMGDGVMLLSVNVQGPAHTGSDYRAIVKGVDGKGAKWVAFVNGNSLAALHESIAEVGQVKGFRWKEDKPWSERSQGT